MERQRETARDKNVDGQKRSFTHKSGAAVRDKFSSHVQQIVGPGRAAFCAKKFSEFLSRPPEDKKLTDPSLQLVAEFKKKFCPFIAFFQTLVDAHKNSSFVGRKFDTINPLTRREIGA